MHHFYVKQGQHFPLWFYSTERICSSNCEVCCSALLRRYCFLIYTYRCLLKHQILINTMTDHDGNMWRHEGTCVWWEGLVYHSYYWFTIYSHTNHCRDVLPKILCGQNDKVSKFTIRCQEHKRKTDRRLLRLFFEDQFTFCLFTVM